MQPSGLPSRRPNRLRDFDYGQTGFYFVTICTGGRACVLGRIRDGAVDRSSIGGIVEAEWLALPARFEGTAIDAFVVMPNHFHGLIGLSEPGAARLPEIVQAFKSRSAHLARPLRSGERRPLWQRSYYDHIVRNDADLDRIRRYIDENPIRWDLDEENPERRSAQ